MLRSHVRLGTHHGFPGTGVSAGRELLRIERMPTRTGTPTAEVPIQRIVMLDALRGFALFGIVVTNAVHAMAMWTLPDPSRPGGAGDTLDRAASAVVEALFAGRFYLLFALLFGYSFTVQIAAAQRVGASVRSRLLRRCAALFVVGMVDLFLLWVGDVLALYGLACLVLIALRGVRPRVAAALGALLCLGWSVWGLLPAGASPLASLSSVVEQPRIHDGYAGSLVDALGTQLTLAPGFFLLVLFTHGVPSLGMFLLGMAAGKRGMLTDTELLGRWAPRVLLAGLAVGIPVSAMTFAATMGWWQAPSQWSGIQQLANPLMTLAYLAAVVLVVRLSRGTGVVWLAAGGRIAATNYIVQSVVSSVLYTGYGFALADQVPTRWVVVIALGTFTLQLLASSWWLRRYRYGPVEWVLRGITYWTIPSWRHSPPDRGACNHLAVPRRTKT